jgi:dihydrodipicolinate synthase/N-acetylneuraminate lyase
MSSPSDPAGQAELIEYLEHLVPQIPLPLFLYNMPSHTKVSFAVETVRRAAQLPGVVGLKDSSDDMIYFQQLLLSFQSRPDFTLLISYIAPGAPATRWLCQLARGPQQRPASARPRTVHRHA